MDQNTIAKIVGSLYLESYLLRVELEEAREEILRLRSLLDDMNGSFSK